MAHKEAAELVGTINEAKNLVEVGGRYFHYKHPDKTYTVTAIGLFEETEEPCVIYQPDDEPDLKWVRPISSYTAEVALEDGRTVSRFQKIA